MGWPKGVPRPKKAKVAPGTAAFNEQAAPGLTVPVAYTDEGVAARSEGKLQATPGVKITKDSWYKTLEAGYNPVQEAIAQYKEPGYAYRGISEMVCEKRGMRGWEPVYDKNGKAIMAGDVRLARMPQDEADARNRHFRKIGNESIQGVTEQHAELSAKASRDSNGAITPMNQGDMIQDYSGRLQPTGITTTRGNRAS